MLTVFFFARLWRRAGVTTDVELASLRYSGRPAHALRIFRALYIGLPINAIIGGAVTLGMVKILKGNGETVVAGEVIVKGSDTMLNLTQRLAESFSAASPDITSRLCMRASPKCERGSGFFPLRAASWNMSTIVEEQSTMMLP